MALNGISLLSSAIALCLATTAIARAEYVPPPYSPPPNSPNSTGTRGPCGQGEQTLIAGSQIALTALAPQTHVGQTSSTHPTVAWFVNDAQSFPIEFHLYEYHAAGERQILKTELRSSPGIMIWSLPETEPGLTVGQRYRWQVVLVCNPNRYSNSRVAGATFDVVSIQPQLTASLSMTTNPLTKSEIYASQGLWYDALRETLNLTTEVNARTVRQRLLSNLVQVEASAATQQNPPSTQVSQLQQIIDFENHN